MGQATRRSRVVLPNTLQVLGKSIPISSEVVGNSENNIREYYDGNKFHQEFRFHTYRHYDGAKFHLKMFSQLILYCRYRKTHRAVA